MVYPAMPKTAATRKVANDARTHAHRTRMEATRLTVSRDLDPARRGLLGQYMTPWPVAKFMASLFEPTSDDVRLLEAGAGAGSLIAAFVDDWVRKSNAGSRMSATAYEVDPALHGPLADTLALSEAHAAAADRSMASQLVKTDFIHAGTERLLPLYKGSGFTHAILNPPYAKINTHSAHRHLLREVGIETVNLYTAFVAVAFALLEKRGELVAIIPRSWCNGSYYRPFREWMEQHGALTHIHLFTSRRDAFKDDAVLQENVVVRWQRDVSQGDVQVSSSSDASFTDFEHHEVPFCRIVQPDDTERYIHIPTKDAAQPKSEALFECSLREIGIDASTGPVVDFRLKEHLRADPSPGAVPLLYAQHFRNGGLSYPIVSKKPNAIAVNDDTRRWLLPNGWYVVTKRFTSKEEPRRIVAHVLDPRKLGAELVGLENHLNVFHANHAGIDEVLAHGLALFLNSTMVDHHFRLFSGHTQVNVTDLRRMRYPTRDKLMAFGKWAKRQKNDLDQVKIDAYIDGNL